MAEQDFPPSPPNPLDPEQNAPETAPGTSRRTQRRVYEPTLLPQRRRRRASPWVIIPSLLLLLGAILYVLLVLPHRRRFVPTAGEIAFASDQGTPGHPHVWVSREDGSGARRLTTEDADETSPAWAPDGSQIAFLAAPSGASPQVSLADADGRNRIAVTQSSGAKAQPALAPSNPELLGFTSGGALSIADVVSGQTSRLLPAATDATHPQGVDNALAAQQTFTITSYAWAPAQDRAQQGLAAIEEAGGSQALVLLPSLAGKPRDTRDSPPGSPLAAAEALTLGWSPDGGLLAVALNGVPGRQPGQPASVLVLLDSQGNPASPQPLAVFPTANLGAEHPVFSPDGTLLVCEIWQVTDLAHQRSLGLFTVPTGGGSPPRPIYKGAAEGVRFSADGRTLLFLHARPGGGHDLCRLNIDGTGFVRISDGIADVSGVTPSPQSRVKS